MKSVPIAFIATLLAACAANKGEATRPQVSDCCASFGIDVNPVLGPHAVDCGMIVSKTNSAATRSRNRNAVACAQRAQLRGRAFTVGRGFSIPPDYFLVNVAVFGALGEKVLVQIEHEHDGPTVFAGSCAELKLLDNGKLEFSGCRADDALLERMKPPRS